LAEYQQEFKHRRLFIGRVPYAFDSEDLLKIFSEFGEIEQAYIVRNPKKGYSKGFGYVVTKTVQLANELHEK
jgi:RNA recognition motif-containing protein